MKTKLVGLLVASVSIFSCVYHDLPEEIDCNLANLTINVKDTVNASVCGAADGSLEIEVSGGMPPYTYAVNNSPEQNTARFEDLTSGFHSIKVFDKNRCTATLDSVLVSVTQFEVTLDIAPDTECLDHNGSIDIAVGETNGPYLFKIDKGTFVLSTLHENLKHGDHFISIQDNDGCSFTRTFTVPRGITSVSWQDDILPIFTTSCAKAGCHDGISRPNDWREYDQVKLHVATIRKRTVVDKSMPFDTSLPDDQIALIACWIDDGALKN